MEQPIEDIEKLTLDDLFSLLKQMRFNQRRYNRTKKPEIFNTLEPLENEVDRLIVLYYERQQKLF